MNEPLVTERCLAIALITVGFVSWHTIATFAQLKSTTKSRKAILGFFAIQAEQTKHERAKKAGVVDCSVWLIATSFVSDSFVKYLPRRIVKMLVCRLLYVIGRRTPFYGGI